MSLWIRRAITLIALVIVSYLFWPLLKEIRAAAHLFRLANWLYLPVIIVVQVLSFASVTWLNLLTLQPFPGRIAFGRLMAVLTSMYFIEIAIPSAGASVVALKARLLGKHGYSIEASTFTLALETIYLVVALATVALLGFFYLFREGDLKPSHVAELAAVVVVGVGFLLWLWRVLNDYQRSHKALSWITQKWNRLLGRIHRLDESQLDQRLMTFQSGLSQFSHLPRWKFLLAAYGRVLLDVATLGFCFRMFHSSIDAGTLLTGYGIIVLLSSLAVLPGGLAVADASVPVIFHRLGTHGSIALAAGLTYRMLSFWLARFIGFISWQYLEGEKASSKE